MSHEVEPTGRDRAEVLLALVRCGRCSPAELSLRTGLSADALQAELGGLEGSGAIEVGRTPGQAAHVRLTPLGKDLADDALRLERAALGARIEPLMPTFDVLNAGFKDLILRWQARPCGSATEVNDHSDARYDERVLSDLGRLGDRIRAVLDELAALRPRYARYRDRFSAALARAGAGEIDFVSGLAVDSAHSVWWELHADLLAVCGRARGDEDA